MSWGPSRRSIQMGECVPSWGRQSTGPMQLLLYGLLCSTGPCLPQACPIVYEVLGPGIDPASELRRSTQRVSHSKDWTKTPRLFWLHLKEEMGRHQCKNSSNNLKGNMTKTESRNQTTRRRLEHPIPEEVEEIDFKRNIMKILKTLNRR